MRSTRSLFCILSVIICHSAPGCGSDAPPSTLVTPDETPLPGERVCLALDSDERLAAVSPEGHAWLVRADGQGTALRVVDPADVAQPHEEWLELGELEQLVAWSGQDASVIAQGGLWRLEDFARVELTVPAAVARPDSLCGDLSVGGAMVGAGSMYEQRDGQWWELAFDTGSDSRPTRAVRVDGACTGRDDTMWLTGDDGALWRVEPGFYSFDRRFESLVDVAAADGMVAAMETEVLWLGPGSWQPWHFEAAPPRLLSAAAGAIWVAVGDELLRYDGVSWRRLESAAAAEVESIGAHASGLWTATGDELCHNATEALVQVTGLRPFTRSRALEYPLTIHAEDQPAVTLDGEALALEGVTGSWTTLARLTTVGWHELRVAADGTERTLWVKRNPEIERSWSVDIAPIAQDHCALSGCHRAGETAPGVPALDNFDAWFDRADAIRLRVVDARNMPPAANQGPDWNADLVDTIAQWLAGGKLP